MNNRPLTAASEDIDNCRALCPNDLLLIRPCSGLPPGVDPDGPTRFQRQWRQVQVLANTFWRRFQKEYIPLLQKRQKWLKPRRNFVENDLILMIDANSPRSQWRLARITKTYPSPDGYVRSIQIRTASGHVFDRPIQKLCLLEGALQD